MAYSDPNPPMRTALPDSGLALLTSAVTLALTAATATAAPPVYRAIPIANAVGPTAINESATVVGTNSSPIRAWISSAGAPAVLLPLPAGMASSWAHDVNEAGVVVGAVGAQYSPEFGGKAAAWLPVRGGYEVVVLGALPGHVASDATALNNVGDIVGWSSNGTYRLPVLFSLSSPPANLQATGLFDPQDVNDERVVVDRSFTVKRLDLATMQVVDLGTPGAGYLATAATAINGGGTISGIAIRTSTTCDREAARFSDSNGWEILSNCGPYNGAQDLNDLGDVTLSAQLMHYVRFVDEGTYAIQSLIDEAEGPWYPFSFTGLAINNAREIALNASHPASGFGGAVLLVPIGPEEDLNGDGTVDAADLTILLAAWGRCQGCAADFDGNGEVEGPDLTRLLAAWGGSGR